MSTHLPKVLIAAGLAAWLAAGWGADAPDRPIRPPTVVAAPPVPPASPAVRPVAAKPPVPVPVPTVPPPAPVPPAEKQASASKQPFPAKQPSPAKQASGTAWASAAKPAPGRSDVPTDAVAVAAGKVEAEEVEAAARQLRRLLGDGFTVIEDAPFVVAGNLPPGKLEALRRDTVRRAASLLWANYFAKRPTRPVRVVVFADERSYRAGVRRLFGEADPPRFGFFRPAENTVAADVSAGPGTLLHELAHALMRPDFPRAPEWFDEGLASLFEHCRFEDGRITGLANWRLTLLKRAAAAGRTPTLAAMMSARPGRFYGESAAENYALARHFCLYLQHRGVLPAAYRRLRDRPADDPAGVRAVLECLSADDLDTVQRDFLRWLAGLSAE